MHTNKEADVLQVFFVEDKGMPGWSVVLKKESRSRRITSTEQEHALGQEGTDDDLHVFANMELPGMPQGEYIAADVAAASVRNGRRRSRNDSC